jgi:DNA repair exonuclease SbcCD nuclease subunit
MLIGIFSDCHCGYKYGEERWKDSFIALNDAVDKTLDCDLIIIPGDLFDTRVPRPEVFAKVAKILSKAQTVPSRTKFLEIINKEKLDMSPLALRGIPIVAISGTHEKRSKHLVNPIQALEHTGLLIHLHCATAVFEIEGRKVAIHGMSGVPDRYAKDVFEQWNPKPIPDALNILMIHQSINPYIYSPLEPPSMDIKDFPKGFDLYILGHMHWHEIKMFNGGQLLVCGSTIPTSIHKIESEQEKCIHKYDGKNIESIPLEEQRKVFWREFDFDPNIKENIENFISTISPFKPKPIINIKVKGLIRKEQLVPSFSGIEEKFSNKAIVNINKNLELEGFQEQIEMLRTLREQKLSPEEHGLKILQENLKQNNCGIKIDEIFEYLVDGDVNLIFNILTGTQTTLKSGLEKWAT